MSRKGEDIIGKLDRVFDQLRRRGVKCQKYESRRGVPLIIVRSSVFDMSICYYARRRDYKWKVFWPWPSGYGKQRYQKLKTEKEVVDYVVGEPTNQEIA